MNDPSDPPDVPEPSPKRKASKSLLRELLETLLLTLVLFGIAHFSLQNFKVDGISMLPTLQSGELILVDKISYRFHAPARGDIIVFKYPEDPTRDFIKRVIALPGDSIAIKMVSGVYHVFVDGKMLSEPYINEAPDTAYPPSCAVAATCKPERVQAGHLFVMGDNRTQSFDSRAWGELPLGNVIGRALISYWPITHLSLLPSQFSYASTHK